MPVYIDPPHRGTWFGKKRMAPDQAKGDQNPIDRLLARLSGSLDRIENNGELDDEMRHSLVNQALTYEEFAIEVRDGTHDPADAQVLVALSSVKSFCELIETEL